MIENHGKAILPTQETDMRKDIQILFRQPDADQGGNPFSVESTQSVRKFHASFPGYSPTPLCALQSLAAHYGVAGIYVKDESRRFGLNAFKALGGSYAIGRWIAEKLDVAPEEMSYALLTSAETRRRIGDVTFATATDGNHGRGVAWTANRLGQKCFVRLPKGTAAERLENIRRLGADVEITDMNYDDTVRFVRKTAEENGWVIVQDTAWPGYTQIPQWIMQGYTTIGSEIADQLGQIRPTHIFLQAGVGAMAGAMAGFFSDLYRDAPPLIGVVEPHAANCVFRTAEADDGDLHAVTGDLRTIMAGLACGEVCPPAWEILRRTASCFVSMPDSVAAKGMRTLGNPLGGDPRVISGESGASTSGFVFAALEDADLRAKLGLNADSRVLCISTEGDTDRENYRRVVWDGAYSE